jgi:hypothetical protein
MAHPPRSNLQTFLFTSLRTKIGQNDSHDLNINKNIITPPQEAYSSKDIKYLSVLFAFILYTYLFFQLIISFLIL